MVQIIFDFKAPFDVILSVVDPTSKQESQVGTWRSGVFGQFALPGTEWRFTEKGHGRPFQRYVTTDAVTQHVEVRPKPVMILSSSKFQQNGEIPKKYTCEGENISPPLAWSDVPANAQSLVLIVEDEDATDDGGVLLSEPWVHWVLYNISPSERAIPEGGRPLPLGALEGVNGRGETGYLGPCPRSGQHHYFHRLLALDRVLPDLGRPSKEELLAQIRRYQSHIVARVDLVGTYQMRE
jgi:Raf kinase inhibitor-like YbhB/YbcL family protein